MRYLALRINDRPECLVHQTDVNGKLKKWEAQVQRNTDLNWETIRAFVTKEEARDYAIGQAMAMRIDTVYNEHGYGLKHLDESWDEYLTRLQEEADAKNE